MVRRVVTGHDPSGKSVVVSDATLDAIIPWSGYEFHRIWGSDETRSFPDSGNEPSYESYFPPVGGFRCWLWTLPPEGDDQAASDDDDDAIAEAQLPGLVDVFEDDEGWHTTDTVDIAIVLGGEIELILDDNDPVTLRAGDVVVQNGTRHRWKNTGEKTAVVMAWITGAERVADPI
jgi:mannose-6-phosphate isomerase-like protein (cupin superfamily)